MEITDYAHLSWDAFQQARSLALHRMRPDKPPPDVDRLLTPSSAVERIAVATTASGSSEERFTASLHTEPR